MVKFWPVSVNNFLVVIKAFCRYSKILVLRVPCVFIYPEFSYRLL